MVELCFRLVSPSRPITHRELMVDCSNGRMGLDGSLPMHSTQLRRHARHSSPSRCLRGRVLRWRRLLPHALLHARRTRLPHRTILWQCTSCRCFQRTHFLRRLSDRAYQHSRLEVSLHHRGRSYCGPRFDSVCLVASDSSIGVVLERG